MEEQRKFEFTPGDTVPESGVYRFVHDPGHAPPEEITAIKGELFPTCSHCRDGRLTLVDDAFNAAGIEQFQV